MKAKKIEKLLNSLEKQSAYLIKVKCTKTNVKHKAILHVGLGIYRVYSYGYTEPFEARRCYFIKIMGKPFKL